SGRTGRGNKAHRVAYLPTHYSNPAPIVWRIREDHAGTSASCLTCNDAGNLRASCHGRQASGAEQSGSFVRGGKTRGSGLGNGLLFLSVPEVVPVSLASNV